MATFRNLMPELLEKRLKRVLWKNYTMIPPIHTKIANVTGSSMAFEDTLKIAGLGQLAMKPEGTPISYDDPVQGARKRVVHETYALGFRVTMEMMDDEQYNVISRMPADLGDATREHKEILFFTIFNTAFATTTYTDADDSLALCANHTLLKGGGAAGTTFENQLNPGVALSVSGMESAHTKFSLTPNNNGRYIQISPSQLLIHPNEAHTAYQLLNTEKEPFTDENQVSTVKSSRSGVVPVESPYLTDTDAWFFIAPKSQHTIIWYNRKGVTFDRSNDGQTKDALYDVHYRASVTWDDWRGVVGSQP